MSDNLLQKIISHSKSYGFIFPSSEIYEGLQAVYDYAPMGVELKNNIKNLWWLTMTRYHENIVGLDSAIFMHPQIWKASGHIDNFSDAMIDNKDSKKRYRVNILLEDRIAKYKEEKKEVEAEKLHRDMVIAFDKKDNKALYDLIISENIVCSVSKTSNWTAVRDFNLMFSTQIGALEQQSNTLYLRPETAQGIFVNFLNIQKVFRKHIPFGIAQVGKAFRNEIIARQFIFRMREFEQMEMQFFICPGEEKKWFHYWSEQRMQWYKKLGINETSLRWHPHENRAHYAQEATDIEFLFPFGFKEIEGIHSRTNFDLLQHEKFSKKKLQIFDNITKKSYIPFVIETSVGLDRLLMAILFHSYKEETKGGRGEKEERRETRGNREEKKRIFLQLPAILAPVKFAVLPLVQKDGIAEKAYNFYQKLRLKYNIIFEKQGTIGKRYTRQDLIGTPYCITFDYQTMEDDKVTIRDRDTMAQEKIDLSSVEMWMEEKLSIDKWFS